MQYDAENDEFREFSRLDHNLSRIHGDMIRFDIVSVDQTTGRFHCVATFADDFQHASLRTNSQVTNALLCVRTREKKQQQQQSTVGASLNRHGSVLSSASASKQTKNAEHNFKVDRDHLMRAAPQNNIPAHLSTPDMNRMSLKDYAESTPQRNRLLNGKLFTRELLHTIDRAAIPDAMK